jgi:hypothetical protein
MVHLRRLSLQLFRRRLSDSLTAFWSEEWRRCMRRCCPRNMTISGPSARRTSRKFFWQYNLWAGERKPKVKLPNRCRYESNYINLIWHTDLQYFHHDGWTIAWIDDRSRMCLGFKFPEQELCGDSSGALQRITIIFCSLFNLHR